MVSVQQEQFSSVPAFKRLKGINIRRVHRYGCRFARIVRAIVAAIAVATTILLARAGAFLGATLFDFHSGSRDRSKMQRRGTGMHTAPTVQERSQHTNLFPSASSHTQAARRALLEDPEQFSIAVDRALEELQAQRNSRRPETDSGDADAQDLNRRIAEVQSKSRLRSVAEIMWLKVWQGFRQLDVPLVPELQGNQNVEFGSVNLKALATQLYSKDAVELIKEHVLGIMGDWDHLTREYPLKLALVQVAQVYSSSALFGYSLRKADLRYQLERQSGNLRKSTQPLKRYLAGFSPDALEQITTITSLEAEIVMKQRTDELFGDLRLLAARASHIQDSPQLLEALANDQLESIDISLGDLRRLALEGVALGYLLGNAEADVDDRYDLTPGSGRCPLVYLGDGLTGEENCAEARSRIFGASAN